ncbi:hypothetical protein N7468_002125 [Penicillium chermesinum]|uniref:PRISE-like Rossmann-fold domain-containing protein n=1 Tax=Penicillium chermesinum TaxID=63820 RepID=A0A9W9PJB2_9EURO|nr:uncharacterized protein N7468_002125 [Penicillium chermesinum]KAJ5247142.1 hypothetical protein N7468_002125 [Penicillium chermesinum]
MTQLIQSKFIFHGLPVLADEGRTAIVVGSNGISGSYQLKVLAESPRRWKKIYAVSRRPPHGQWPDHVEHVSIDLLQDPEDIAAQFAKRGIKPDYAFFFAYIQPKPRDGEGIWSAAEEMVAVNTKYYGLHEGPAIAPQEESDPRLLGGPPNFYYHQEDMLKEFAAKHKVGWNTTRPSHIIGAVPDAAMNLCYPLAVYATVQKHLGEPLQFPGDPTAWDQTVTLSTAKASGYLGEWMVLTDQTKNESFNAVDDCPFTWSKFWPKLAEKFGIPWRGPDLSDKAVYETMTLPTSPPRGYGPPGVLRYSFQLVEWAKRTEVQEAWKKIAETYSLCEKELRDVDEVFGFTDIAVAMTYPIRLR